MSFFCNCDSQIEKVSRKISNLSSRLAEAEAATAATDQDLASVRSQISAIKRCLTTLTKKMEAFETRFTAGIEKLQKPGPAFEKAIEEIFERQFQRADQRLRDDTPEKQTEKKTSRKSKPR